KHLVKAIFAHAISCSTVVEQLTHILWNTCCTYYGTAVAQYVQQEIEGNKHKERLLKSTNSCARYGS
ncbi:MAG TPA: hypothetical protein K8W04_11305, partial [Bacteroides reticulotermitis]|nr:hypothetical protein [Bacteroides reticulotermitis]